MKEKTRQMNSSSFLQKYERVSNMLSLEQWQISLFTSVQGDWWLFTVGYQLCKANQIVIVNNGE